MQSSSYSQETGGLSGASDTTSDGLLSTSQDGNIEHLVASDDVVGTSVVGIQGETIGSIDQIMIDKKSGRVAYAVMSFGGFMGLGKNHYPIPWSMLRYDTQNEVYRVDISEEQLNAAPSWDVNDTSSWRDRQSGNRLHDYYGAAPYWTL